MTQPTIKSPWSNRIYPCSSCSYVGELDAFRQGQCYHPCPRCGGKREKGPTGRFVYSVSPHRWVPFLTTRTFVAVEWRASDKTP